jgi:hypothetical protein
MSKIEVNTVAPQCGTTLTLGESGDTVTLGSGASQSGFGRTGTVDWQTGDIKTSTFTAVNGQGFFCDTNGGGFTVNLPAGSAGAIVSLQDYRNTFDTASLTVAPNGSEKINGGTGGGVVILSTEGEGITLVYIDSTVGWRSIQDNTFADASSTNLTATGGSISDCGNFRIHTFTGPGTFCVSQISGTAAENTVGYQVVAGGGSGGTGYYAAGGGAGGFREGRNAPIDNFTASPLVANAPTNAVTVTATAFPITVGAGGAASPNCAASGGDGSASIFSTITSAGGGGGASRNCGSPGPAVTIGNNGGSGGGGTNHDPFNASSKGTGNTPSVTPSQGNPGGAGGYGGAGAAGTDAPPGSPYGNVGGNGVSSSITGSSVDRAGGGGGASDTTLRSGGSGGGGTSGRNSPQTAGTAGTANTGGGGGGGSNPSVTPTTAAGAGGSGIVIIRYKFQ